MREMLHHARLHSGEPLFPAMLSFVRVIGTGSHGPDEQAAYKHHEDPGPDLPDPSLLYMQSADHGSPIDNIESAVAMVSSAVKSASPCPAVQANTDPTNNVETMAT